MINGVIKELMRGIEIAAEPINQQSRALEDTSTTRNLVRVHGLLGGWGWGRGRGRGRRCCDSQEVNTQRTIQGLKILMKYVGKS